MTELSQKAEQTPTRRANRRSAVFLFAALLPLVGYIGSIGPAEAQRLGAPTIQVAIEGYDPRDMFRGHYLQYRVSTEGRRERDAYPMHACAGPARGAVSPVYLFDAQASEGLCQYALPVHFVQGLHRFYVQQTSAPELEKALMGGRAQVTLRVISDTHVAVEHLLIDGKPWRSALPE
jgi:hypothetical protein